MTEREFWGLLEKMLEKGRAQQVVGAIGPAGAPGMAYLQGHSLLPRDYDKLSGPDIIWMGQLLLLRDTSYKAKETIMMILAHQPNELALTFLAKYCLAPDKGLEYFAEMALEECAWWNEPG
jgi:hypothetical protein